MGDLMISITPGQQLGPYQITQQIGQGGMAAVYKAYHAAMDRYVAIKVVIVQFADDPNFLQRFQQEARVIAKLEHPHILPVHDFGQVDGIPYMVMRFLDAGTLKERISSAPLTLTEIDRIFSQLTDALQYSHDHGVIHRDIKPSNVMLDKRGDIFLTDFGVAKILEGTSQLTATGAITGTPAYMSPEQAQGKRADPRSDIYSLGVVLYEMLTGKVPFEAETPMAVIFKHIQEPPPLLTMVRSDLPYTIEAVLLKALAKDPQDRFESMDAFRDAWKNALNRAETLSGVLPVPHRKAAPTMVGVQAPAVDAPPSTTTPPVYQTTPPVVPANPAGIRPVWWGVAGGLMLCLLCCALGFFAMNQFPLTTRNQPPTLPVSATASATPRSLEATPTEELTPIPSALTGTQSWAASNIYYSLAFDGDRLLAAGPGGLSIFEPDGSYQQMTTATGMPASWVFDVFVDEPGHLWVATWNGVVEINEGERRYYGDAQGLSTIYVRAIARVNDDEIWAATQYSDNPGQGLYTFDGKNWKPVAGFPSSNEGDAPGTVSNNVYELSVTTKGIWAGTQRGLALRDPDENWHVFTTENGLPDTGIGAVFEDSNGTIWVGCGDGSILLYDPENETFNEFANLEERGGSNIYQIAEDENGNIWFASTVLARYNLADERWDYFSSDQGSLPVSTILSIVTASDGSLYFGSNGEGLVHFDGEDFTTNYQPNLPRFGYYRNVVENRKGDYYFIDLYNGGVDVFTPAKNAWSYLPEKYYFPLAFDTQGNLWSGSDDGLWIFADKKVTNLTTAHGLISNSVWTLAFDESGNAYLGGENGVALFDGKEVTETYTLQEMKMASDAAIRGLYYGPDSSLWVWSYNSMSRKTSDNTWENFAIDNLFDGGAGEITDIVQDGQGVIWVATRDDGLYRYDGADWTRFKATDPGVELPTNYLTCLTVGPDGALWIGTYWNGLVRYDGSSWRTYDQKDGLIHLLVYDLLFDPNGNAWVATDGGVSYLELSEK